MAYSEFLIRFIGQYIPKICSLLLAHMSVVKSTKRNCRSPTIQPLLVARVPLVTLWLHLTKAMYALCD